MRENTLKRRLKDGKPAFGTGITFNSAEAVEFLGLVGYDFIFIDGEHAGIGPERCYDLVRAANAVGVEPVVRAPSSDPGVIQPYLETGASTIIVPHCSNAGIVRLAVSAGKHPPKGVRGVGSGSRAANYGLTQTPVQYFAEADEQTLILPMIEDAEAIKNIDAILAVEGLEGIFIGLGDLSMTMGYRGGQNHPAVQQAVSLVIEKAKARGLIVSASGGRDVESARAMVRQGIQMVLSSAATLLADACRGYLKGVRE